jgi:hypothetical protein
MTQLYSNVSEVPLSLAVFLASDDYDYNDDPNTISATTLLKPIRQIILSSRVPAAQSQVDLSQMMASRMGSALHGGIERAWTQNHQAAMAALGYPKRVTERVRINPKPEELTEGVIPVYLEQRAHKQVGKYIVSGKFDFVGEGQVEDFKSTSTYTAMNHTNDEKYVWQGSIYRWLSPKIITSDKMAIRFLFTDWSAAKARMDPKYPQRRFQSQIFDLRSMAETEAFIKRKLALIDQYRDAPESELPYCTDEELWRSTPVYKYYKDPAKRVRSTKNFENKQDAMLRYVEDGSVGIVVDVPGQVNACKYCPAFPICSQKDELIRSGDLIL